MIQSIKSTTKLFALFGHPVSHSLSPAIQNQLIKQVGDDAVYLAFDIENDDVEKAVSSIRALSIAGVNVTAPHKQAVIPYLDEIHEKAKKFRAVNVIKNDKGHLIGYNTDVEGLFMYLKTQNITICSKDVLILGAGGLASSLLTGIWDENPKSVSVINRTAQKAIELADRIGNELHQPIATTLKGTPYDIVINAATAGMHPHEDTCALESLDGIIDRHTVVVDSIYNPQKTLLLKRAEEVGATIFNGFGMLICQALLSYEIFTNQKLSPAIYDKFIHIQF